jgi:predicted TIM-barrel fold metal-dependent hydrolase
MRIWDCHSHCKGAETGEQVLRWMDAAGVERINLFSRFPGGDFRDPKAPPTRQAVRDSIEHIAAVQAADPSRIFGLVWINPRAPGMLEELERGLVDRRLRGAKMMPDHWYPSEEWLFPFYEKMAELGKPIEFHSGILYAMRDSSRFCQPVGFEVLVNFPRLRFSLAHIGWPWVDECLAVFGRFRAAAEHDPAAYPACQMWVDTCRGTPDAWREEALRKAVPFVGIDRLMFGVDGTPETLPKNGPVHINKDIALLRDVIGLPQPQIEKFFWSSCEEFYQ